MDCCFPDVSAETMSTWWFQLKKSNKLFIKKRTKLEIPFFAASEKMVSLLCNIGHQMELSREILLSSITLFDRFMIYSYNKMNEEDSYFKKMQFMEGLKNNMTLALCSCLQLASKVLGHRELWVPDIVKFMTEYGHEVTKADVIKSEQNVFQTLKYKVPASSPLTYVETLAHLLPMAKLSLECSLFMETCAQFMMVATCHHQAVYDSLFYVLTSKEKYFYKDRLEFVSVEMDCVYLSGAVVLAASQTLGVASSPTPGRQFLSPSWLEKRLQDLTGLPAQQLLRLALILMDIATDPANSDS